MSSEKLSKNSPDNNNVIPGTLSKYNSTESLKSSPVLFSSKFGSMESLKTPGTRATRSFRIQSQTSFDSSESNSPTPIRGSLNLNTVIETERKGLSRKESGQNRNEMMEQMRKKFQEMNTDLDDGLTLDSTLASTSKSAAATPIPDSVKVKKTGDKLWGKLGNVISATSEITRKNSVVGRRSSAPTLSPRAVLEMSEKPLTSYWENFVVQQPELIPIDYTSTQALEGNYLDVSQPKFDYTDIESIEIDFDNESKSLLLAITKIPEEVINEKNANSDMKRVQEEFSVLEMIKKKELDVIWRENLARERVKTLEKESLHKIKNEREKLKLETLEKANKLSNEFKKVREQLEAGIKRQMGAVRESFGKIYSQNQSLARRFFAFSQMVPQPIEIRIHLMRALKSKLPKGNYVIMLTQFDSLGGLPLSWSEIGTNGIGNLRSGITKVFQHGGRFFDRTVKIEDSCFALCPPRPVLKPSFVFVLELFELAGRNNPYDKIVGWTAVPMSFESMSLIEGKLKLPMLRDEHSPMFQTFKSMEQAVADDLTNWLCNIYIEVRQMSLEELGATDNILQTTTFDIDFLNKKFVSTDDNVNSQNDDVALEEGTKSEKGLIVDKGLFRRKNHMIVDAGGLTAKDDSLKKDKSFSMYKGSSVHPSKASSDSFELSYTPEAKEHKVTIDTFRRHILMSNSNTNTKYNDFRNQQSKLILDWKQKYTPKTSQEEENTEEVRERGYNVPDEYYLHQEQRGKLSGVETVDGVENRHWASAGLEGKIVRRWQSEGLRYDSESILKREDEVNVKTQNSKKNMLSSGQITDKDILSKGWEELRDPREMDDYSMALVSDQSKRRKKIQGAKARSKLRYLYMELFGDMAPYMFGTFEFFMTLVIFLFAFWLRIYIHYLAGYLYLLSVGTPVYDFQLEGLQIQFKYMSTSITASQETALVIIGPVANIVFFILLFIVGYLINKLHHIPIAWSKFFASFGLATVLDPILLLIVDLGYHNYNCTSVCSDYVSSDCKCFYADSSKLYYRMLRVEGSGITGIFITLLLYFGSTVISFLLLYHYLVYIHREGRILDLWRRINAPTEEFYLPHDYEVSIEEMNDILNRAKTWKGPIGYRRVVSIVKEIDSKYYTIYEVDPSGIKTIYRQFSVDVNTGMTIEVFQELKNNSSESVKKRNIFSGSSNPSMQMNRSSSKNTVPNDIENNANVEEESTPLLL